jgi:hypothetical protein
MTNLELLSDLNRRHARLEEGLSLLKADLLQLQARLESAEPPALPKTTPIVIALSETSPEPSPVPVSIAAPPQLPPLPRRDPPPVTAPEAEPATARPTIPAAEEPAADRPGFELQFGRWLARIGVVFALLTLVFFSVLVHNTLYRHLGPWSKLTILTLVSGGLIAGGLRLESRDRKLLVYGRTLAGGGLACLYYTLYGATYVPQLHVIGSPFFGGLLLLAWSAAVLYLAERRQSELLSIFALSLAYFSSAITPGNGFVMTADLLLAATAVVFLVRNAWTGLSYLCLIGTYAGFLRQAVDYRGPLDFDWIGILPFWPSAVYLSGAWLIFTAGILLSRSTAFTGGKRLAFLCLNNGAWAGLLLVAAWLGHFGHNGGILLTVGATFLASFVLARITRPDDRDLTGAYLAQGLAFVTGGIVLVYAGVTRGLLLIIESIFLVSAGAYSRNSIVRIGGIATSILGAAFLAWEIPDNNAFPRALTLVGTLALLANAWLARRPMWDQPRELARKSWVPESVLHIVLALGLLAIGFVSHASNAWIAPDLTLAAVALTAVIYFLPLFELPVLAQSLLIFAQIISFALPFLQDSGAVNFGEFLIIQPQWNHNLVAFITLLLVTWWPRQKQVFLGDWFQLLEVLSAFALVAFTWLSIHPHATPQTWMISAALLSLVFLAYGAWSRLWSFALVGQILLAMAVFDFLNPVADFAFPWSGWAAAIPIAVVYATSWIGQKLGGTTSRSSAARAGGDGATADQEVGTPGDDADFRNALKLVARVYQSIAVGLLVRWVFGVAPDPEITLTLIALGTAFICGGLVGRSSFAIRSGLVLSAVGIAHYAFAPSGQGTLGFTWVDALAFTLFLAQPALLRRWGRGLVTFEESWGVVLVSSGAAWLFVSNSVTAYAPQNLTLGWALYALALTLLGFVADERRQRWCGLGILAAAFVRVAVHDFWVFSDLYKVLTFLALTVICLGLSFLYYKFADRLKEWL